MRLLQLAKPVTLILLSGTLVAFSARAVMPAFAPSKLRLCQPCEMPSVRIPLPRRGIVLAYGAIFGDGSGWYFVDLDRAEATLIRARVDRSTGEQNVVEKVTRPLPPGELSALTQLVSHIWASKEALPSDMATDVVWDMWLLDDGDVRREGGAGRPDGLAKEVAQIMQRSLFEPKVPAQPSASP